MFFLFLFEKRKNSSFFILKTSYFILNLPFSSIFIKSLCTSTASILLICTEKPHLKLPSAKPLIAMQSPAHASHVLCRVLVYLRTVLLKNLQNTCTKHKKRPCFLHDLFLFINLSFYNQFYVIIRYRFDFVVSLYNYSILCLEFYQYSLI